MRTRSRLLITGFALVAGLCGGTSGRDSPTRRIARADEDHAAILARIESTDPKTRSAAVRAWDKLSEAERLAAARKALTDPNAPGAMQAADRTSAIDLGLDDQQRQFEALCRWSNWDGESLCVGGPEALVVLRRKSTAQGTLDLLGHVLRSSDLPELVRLADAVPSLTPHIRGYVARICFDASGHRDIVAPFLAKQLREQREDAPAPPSSPPGSGLPPHFQAIATAVWGMEGSKIYRRWALRIVPDIWVTRWLRNITPTVADLPFLDQVVDLASNELVRAWAVRQRVRLAPKKAATWLRAVIDNEGARPLTAGHLALAGERDVWDELTKEDAEQTADCPLVWRIDRRRAIREWAADVAHLTPRERDDLSTYWGVDLGEKELENLLFEWELAGCATSDLITAYATSAAPLLRGEALAALTERLRSMTDIDPGERHLRVVLGLLELRAPDQFRELISSWSEDPNFATDHAFAEALKVPAPPLAPESPASSVDQYWTRMFRHAVDGDASAQNEFARALTENRTWLFQHVAFDAAPRTGVMFTPQHLERLSNSYLAHRQSTRALRASYPTIPLFRAHAIRSDAAAAREWYAASKDRLTWSRIANGWLVR